MNEKQVSNPKGSVKGTGRGKPAMNKSNRGGRNTHQSKVFIDFDVFSSVKNEGGRDYHCGEIIVNGRSIEEKYSIYTETIPCDDKSMLNLKVGDTFQIIDPYELVVSKFKNKYPVTITIDSSLKNGNMNSHDKKLKLMMNLAIAQIKKEREGRVERKDAPKRENRNNANSVEKKENKPASKGKSYYDRANEIKRNAQPRKAFKDMSPEERQEVQSKFHPFKNIDKYLEAKSK